MIIHYNKIGIFVLWYLSLTSLVSMMKFFYYSGFPTSSSWVNVRFWNVTLCDFCAVEPCGFFRSLTWKAFGTIALGKICFVILWDGYSSYSGLVFPCFIHGDDIGFTPWVELNIKSFVLSMERFLSLIFGTYLLSILDLWNFGLHFK